MSPSTIRVTFFLFFLVCVCCCQSANAQGLTGQISGTLTDSSGGSVINAKIEVINQKTAQVRTATSDSEGNFVVTELLPGTYSLIVSASGFKKFEQTGIVLTANGALTCIKSRSKSGTSTRPSQSPPSRLS